MKKNFIFFFFGAFMAIVHAQTTPSYWDLTGNPNVTSSNFLGTTNSNPLIFKTNNIERMRLTEDGYVGIGTNTPTVPLHLHYQYPYPSGRSFPLFQITSTDINSDIFRSLSIYSFGRRSDIYIKQEMEADLSIAGYANSLTFNSNGNVLLSSQMLRTAFHVEMPMTVQNYLKAHSLEIATDVWIQDALTAKTLNVQSANITSTLTTNTLIAKNAQITNITGTLTANALTAQSAKVSGLLCAKEVRVSLTGAPCWPDFVFSKDYKLLPLHEVEQFIAENQHLPNVPSAAEVKANGVELGEMNALLLQKVEELTLYIIQLEKRLSEVENRKGGE